ncbi:MBL fold metallo-hydrolase [Rhodoferax sp.]|uniref:MBL fold metallo-hydrolase n=1 Tax=Rhodoferax sp. TaxID=50421 RepID=UPI0025CEF14C|nr:MBL fold metallo-hydrolase [Rhodoferax sp.]MCM2295415.1 MBL fold metallo-hydrolase [Rhodoferax sp.]
MQLPHGITLFERGWLSSNNILIRGKSHCALVDSGYASHATQTLALVQSALHGQPLDLLLNTHLHSDHCGGNALLQAHYPQLQTLIPPGHARFVTPWDPVALSYQPTGQTCPAFAYSATLQPDTEIMLGDQRWEIHAAPGHDPHSVILFQPEHRLLISADALWENGFGVVFPELDGADAFNEVGQTLDVIEALAPAIVIPGHGTPFSDVAEALARARRRLDGFAQAPEKHLRYAAKVLLKFKLLDARHLPLADLLQWAQRTPLMQRIYQSGALAGQPFQDWVLTLVDELVRSGAASRDQQIVSNA